MTTRLASLPDDGRNPLSMFFKRMVLASLLLLGVAATGANAASHAAPSDKDIVDAWTYLYGRYLVVQQENHDINVEKVGYNKIKYNPLGSAQFVNPNLDVAYLEAWLAVDKDHAVILNVPRVEGRYESIQKSAIQARWRECIHAGLDRLPAQRRTGNKQNTGGPSPTD